MKMFVIPEHNILKFPLESNYIDSTYMGQEQSDPNDEENGKYFEYHVEHKNWLTLCKIYILSEDFIRQFQNEVIWEDISYYQKLSKEFIIEFSDKINFSNIMINDKISNEIKEFCKIFI